jgi:hypothetical protein
MLDCDLSYLAGFFDGEGSIVIRANDHTIYLQVNVTQTDPRPLQLYVDLFGGRVSKMHDKSYWKKSYIWQISSHKAAAALEKMLPYLTVKKAQAELALEFQKLIPPVGTKFVGNWGEREVALTRMHDLKQIEYNIDGTEFSPEVN